MMTTTQALFIPDAYEPGKVVPLTKAISAIPLLRQHNGGAKLGLLSQLRAGVTVETCGEGFTERTVKVRVGDRYYFVFLQDVEESYAFT